MRLATAVFFIVFCVFAPMAQAFYTTMDTGQLLKEHHYKLAAETQFITEGLSGVNLAVRLDGVINDELGWKTQLGFGTTNVFGGGFFKWVPIPDTASQPAFGLIAGVVVAQYDDNFDSSERKTKGMINELSLRAHPFVSKEFNSDLGEITPFAALPFGIRSADGRTTIPIQIALGADFKPISWEKISLVTEIGFDLAKAFPYIAFGATLEFDDDHGLVFK